MDTMQMNYTWKLNTRVIIVITYTSSTNVFIILLSSVHLTHFFNPGYEYSSFIVK